MKATVVIGANYGDEGKGLITDYLSAAATGKTVVIRFNGGAQAGHTVQTPEGLRHVFRHFSSGSFAGAQTYLSEFFIANPILFIEELKKLKSFHILPKVAIHPAALVTTPYDMYINQLFEDFRAHNRHGSCGVGINETVERNLYENFQLTINDLFNQKTLREKLVAIREKWVELRLYQLISRNLTAEEKEIVFSDEIFEFFLNDIQIFLSYCEVADYDYCRQGDKLIFEGAQGLLLDQGHKNFPHVTRSNTGLQNVSYLTSLLDINHLDIYYVTRCYFTRHGAGPLPNEFSSCPCPDFKDETNLPHKFQGVLRFAPLNINKVRAEILGDLSKLSGKISKKVTLAVTCLDQFQEKIPIVQKNGSVVAITKNEFFNYVFNNTDFDNYLFSNGPRREDCKFVESAVAIG